MRLSLCRDCSKVMAGQVWPLCEECTHKRIAQAGDEIEIPVDWLGEEPAKRVTWLDRLKAWASRWAAYLDALLLRLL